MQAVGTPAPNPGGSLSVFFTSSAASRQSGMETLGRLTARTEDRDKPTTRQTRQAQYDAVSAGGSRITGCCSESVPSASPCSWRVATAIP